MQLGKRSVLCTYVLWSAACGQVDKTAPGADASVGMPDEGTAVLSFEPDKIDFGTLLVGAQSISVTITVFNRGDATSGPLAVNLSGTDAPDFSLDASSCAEAKLTAGSSCTVQLAFSPDSAGYKQADLSIVDGDTVLKPLFNGLALQPGALAMAPGTWDFGATDLGTLSATRKFTITNTGGDFSTPLATSTSNPAFVISNNLCAGAVLKAGAACTLDVRFKPVAGDLGSRVGSVVVMTAATGTTASLGGTGQVLVTVARAGAGAGTVTSSPAGLSCGSTCSARFRTSVSLVASTTGANTFVGWGGACSGAASVCTLSLSQAASVAATFEPYKQLSVAKVGTGTGTLTSSPGGINCGATCGVLFPHGGLVTVIPTPNPGFVFAGWSGACAGGGGCTVSMTQAQSVTATFNCANGLSCTKSGCFCL